MQPDMVTIGNLQVSRFILGGNPISGFSHQSREMDNAQRHYFTTARIKEMLFEAERLGVNTHLSRADHHVMRYLMEYRDEGGKLQWIAQTCPQVGSIELGVQNGLSGGASAVFLHGGMMDFLLAQGRQNEALDGIKMIQDAGLPAGLAGHNPRVFEWAEEHANADFYMCSYYNPTRRDENPGHKHGAIEAFDASARGDMAETIKGLSKPAIHYKVLAAGRNDPAEAFAFVARNMRPNDSACVGIYPADKPNMMQEDIDLLMGAIAKQKGCCG